MPITEVVTLFHQIKRCSSEHDLYAAIQEIKHFFKADGFAFGTHFIEDDKLIPSFYATDQFGIVIDGVRWVDLYEKYHYQNFDPIIQHSQVCNGAFNWVDAVSQIELSEDQKQLLRMAEEYQMFSGAAVGLRDTKRQLYYVMTISNVELDEEALAAFELFFSAFLDVIGHIEISQKLSAKEHDIFQLIVAGLSIKQIAPEQGITERTVKFHLKNIYEKLRVNNKTEALAFALSHSIL